MTARLVEGSAPGWTWVERDVGAFAVRGAVLVAGGDALVWDTLVAPSDMTAVAELVAGRRVTVVYSHADWDHCWGTAGLVPVEIVAHHAAVDRFARELPQTLVQFRLDEPGRWDDVVLVPPTRRVGSSGAVSIGGHTIELASLPGHTPDSLVAWAPDWGVLLAGDVAEDPWPTVGDAAAVPGWAAALERWAGLAGVRTVVPGHGAVSGPKLLTRSAAYLRRLQSLSDDDAAASVTDFYAGVHEANRALMRAAK